MAESEDGELGDYFDNPELFAEGFQGVLVRNGVVKINLFTNRFDLSTKQERKRGVATLVIPLPDLVAITDGLNRIVNEMKDKGVIEVITIPEAETVEKREE